LTLIKQEKNLIKTYSQKQFEPQVKYAEKYISAKHEYNHTKSQVKYGNNIKMTFIKTRMSVLNNSWKKIAEELFRWHILVNMNIRHSFIQ